ncbi:MAG: hypothetical protein HRT88_17600, partial [Lentisphaeraceae bacterium]|nr:hypothetical protein [Lentisphaeraceae bacterium]
MILSFISCRSLSEHTENENSQDEDFREALGFYAQGLLVYRDDRSKGLESLYKAIKISPQQHLFIDEWLRCVKRKFLMESDLNSETSDFEELHNFIAIQLSPIVQENPRALYLTRYLVDTYIQLNELVKAANCIDLAKIHNTSGPELMLTELMFLQKTDENQFLEKTLLCRQQKSYRQYFPLQLFLVDVLASFHGTETLVEARLHASLLIDLIPHLKKNSLQGAAWAELLAMAILKGSDIGEGARLQLYETFSEHDRNEDVFAWSSLAGTLIKLNMYRQAETVIFSRVLQGGIHTSGVYLRLAECAQNLGAKNRRMAYLEKAFSLQSKSVYIRKLLLASAFRVNKFERSLELIKSIKKDDAWLMKMNFYTLNALRR